MHHLHHLHRLHHLHPGMIQFHSRHRRILLRDLLVLVSILEFRDALLTKWGDRVFNFKSFNRTLYFGGSLPLSGIGSHCDGDVGGMAWLLRIEINI